MLEIFCDTVCTQLNTIVFALVILMWKCYICNSTFDISFPSMSFQTSFLCLFANEDEDGNTIFCRKNADQFILKQKILLIALFSLCQTPNVGDRFVEVFCLFVFLYILVSLCKIC